MILSGSPREVIQRIPAKTIVPIPKNNAANSVVYHPNLIAPKPILNSDFVVNLTEEQLNLKKMIVRDIYGYPNEKGFELMSCNKIETFNVDKF